MANPLLIKKRLIKLEPTGLRPVTQVAIDDVWSALRFRPADKVKKR
jgi:hypothetical protein